MNVVDVFQGLLIAIGAVTAISIMVCIALGAAYASKQLWQELRK